MTSRRCLMAGLIGAVLVAGVNVAGLERGRLGDGGKAGTHGRGERAGREDGKEVGSGPRAAATWMAWARVGPSGLRRVAAGWSWVQARRAWERGDVRGFRQALLAAVALRPEHRRYWIDGARMLAFDVPQWRGGGTPERRRGVEEALRFLERAERLHPMAFAIPLEIGWLRGWELGDLAGAERALERAARLAPRLRAPAQLRARVLERLGRAEEARAWLAERASARSPDRADALSQAPRRRRGPDREESDDR